MRLLFPLVRAPAPAKPSLSSASAATPRKRARDKAAPILVLPAIVEQPGWAQAADPAAGVVSLGSLPGLALAETFGAADYIALLGAVDTSGAIAKQSTATAGAGYGVLQDRAAGGPPAYTRLGLLQPRFASMLQLCQQTAAERLHVPPTAVKLRFIKLDSGSGVGAASIRGVHKVHQDVFALWIVRVCISLFFRDMGCPARGGTFKAGAVKAGPFTIYELLHGAISAQLGAVGFHGFEGLPPGLMRMLIVVDVNVECWRKPEPSVRAWLPKPTAFELHLPVEVPAGTAAYLANMVAEAPQSRESERQAWRASISASEMRRLQLERDWGSLNEQDSEMLERRLKGSADGGASTARARELPRLALPRQARPERSHRASSWCRAGPGPRPRPPRRALPLTAPAHSPLPWPPAPRRHREHGRRRLRGR